MLGPGAALELLMGALLLRADTVAAVVGSGAGVRFAFLVLVLAGLSEALGESVVLFLNRVRPRYFIRSLLISALIFAFTYLFLAASIWVVARFGFRVEVGLLPVAAVVAVAQAPRLFGFLVFLPYFGLPVSVLLWIWSLLATTRGVASLLELAPWQAAVTVALGGLLLITLQRTIGRPLLALARLARGRAAGVDLITDRDQLRELIDSAPDAGLVQRPQGPASRRYGPQ